VLDDLGSQVEAIGLLLAVYLFLWQSSVSSQAVFDTALSDENILGATGLDAHNAWATLRRHLPLLLVVFFGPILIAAVFAPPAVEILVEVRPSRSYSPLRAAFLVIEGVWVLAATLLARRGLSLIRLARYMREEAAHRWPIDRQWFRQRARKKAKPRQASSLPTQRPGSDH
jgi:hypothetical protein